MTTERHTEFGFLVARIARRMRQAVDAEMRLIGLTEATWRPLMYVRSLGDGVRQKELATAMSIEGPSLVRVVDLLIGEGLLTRREDPSDRRAKLLKLTARGEDRVLEIETAARRMRDRMLADVAPADLATAVRVLSKIEQTLLRDWDS